jgi:uncharacterized membrane protein
MARVIKSISIEAPVEKVFGYFDDPTNLPEVWPSLLEVSEVKRLPNGGSSFRFVYKMAALRFEGTSEDVDYIPNELTITESKGGIDSTITLTYRPEGEGTRLTFENEYTVPIPVLGRLAEAVILRQNEREVELILANVKDALEA